MMSYVRKATYEEGQRWKKRVVLLQHLTIELTERCNYGCVHCSIRLPCNELKAKNAEMSREQIGAILQEAALLDCRDITLSGGEPLIRDDFLAIYELVCRLGMRPTVLSNGSCVTHEIAERISTLQPHGNVVLSVYGLSANSYERVSGVSGSFKKSMNGLSLLRQYKVPVIINFPILPQNWHESGEVEKWFMENFGIENVVPLQMYLDLHSRRKKVDSERIKKHRLTPDEQLKLRINTKNTFIKDYYKHFSNIRTLSGASVFDCGAGCGKGTVDAYGMLQMCSRLRHPETVYDLKQGSLKDAYISFFSNLRLITSQNNKYLKRCGSCFLKGVCDHCAATSWNEFGDLESISEYICRIAQLEAEYLGLLGKGEKSWLVPDWKERVLLFMQRNRAES